MKLIGDFVMTSVVHASDASPGEGDGVVIRSIVVRPRLDLENLIAFDYMIPDLVADFARKVEEV